MILQGIVAIITGGGTGIGRATALLLAERGAFVVVCGRRTEPLLETIRLIERLGFKASFSVTDVRKWDQVTNMVNTVLERFGKIDVLINNAGVALAADIADTKEEDWNIILDTNLKGTFLCCKAVIPTMSKACRGIIVNVSSILGKTGIANMGAYCVSKFGVIGLTQTLADELKSRNIQAYAACPGPTYTELHCKIVGEDAGKTAAPPEYVSEKIIGIITGDLKLPSGGSLVIDEQAVRPAHNKAKVKLVAAVYGCLKPLLPILRKLRNPIK